MINARRALEQIIDEQTRDKLLRAGFDAAALETARTLVTTFRQFIVDHKDEIEALQLLYSQPYRAGLRYRHVKELASKLRDAPFFVDPQEPKCVARLWQAFAAVEPQNVRGSGGKQLVDLIALVRHALDPQQPLCPLGDTVEERFQTWLAEKETLGTPFTPDQRRWLIAIKDHIATSLSIDQDDFDSVPFNQFGGLGKAYELFGDTLTALLEELNARLAA